MVSLDIVLPTLVAGAGGSLGSSMVSWSAAGLLVAGGGLCMCAFVRVRVYGHNISNKNMNTHS